MNSAWFHQNGWELGGFLIHRALGSRPKLNTPSSNSSASVRIENWGRSNETADATEPVLDALITGSSWLQRPKLLRPVLLGSGLTLILNPQH
jgi:hypothetical protein